MKKLPFILPGLLSTLALQAQDKPNILILLSDDQSAWAAGCYGNPDIRTPVLDRLASEGVMFSRSYCTSPQSVPARASLLTGMTPISTGMTRFNCALEKKYKSFMDYLKDSGYYVGILGRKHHMDGPAAGKYPEIREYYEKNGFVNFSRRLDYAKTMKGERNGANHGQIFELFKEYMEGRDTTRPFCVEVNYSDPHRPYDAPSVHNPAKLHLPGHFPDTKLVREDLAAYYDEIYRMDSDVGQVLAYLEDHGLKENTLIIFLGDNGGAQWMAKGTLYEQGVRTPLIISWEGHINAGGKVDRIVSHEDIAPTIMDYASLAKGPDMCGESLRPLLEGTGDIGRKWVYSARLCHATHSLPEDTSVMDQQRCIISERFKLIYNLLPGLGYVPMDFQITEMYLQLKDKADRGRLKEPYKTLYFSQTRPMFELYDLENDPTEQHNLIDLPEYADIQKELIMQLTFHMIDDRDFVTLPFPKAYH
ncbi:MAG: sulfatase [Bacteroidales bacterium]|nr:sulfatase [Bacteroidales bacterium]